MIRIMREFVCSEGVETSMPLTAIDGYLADESRFCGTAEKAVSIHTESELVAFLEKAQSERTPITTQGGLTGITGAAVPQGGAVVSMRDMRRLLGLREDKFGFCLRAEPGCTLDGIRQRLVQPEDFDLQGWSESSRQAWRKLCRMPTHMFAPDLTETGATLGGVVSTNGSGARSYYYGATRKHIVGLRIVLPGGDILQMRRGDTYASGLSFSLESESGKQYAGRLPVYSLPQVKHAAGLYAAPDMDLIDLFIGAEGILGVISEVEIRLIPRPKDVCGLTVFLPSEAAALELVEHVRSSSLLVYALEYFSSQALDLLRDPATQTGEVRIPPLEDHWHTALYIEWDTARSDAFTDVVGLLERVGGNEDDTWLAEGYEEIETLKGIRHAIPERINGWVAEQRKRWPAVTKLGTDLAVPDAHMRQVMRMYHEDLRAAGLPYVIFGHIGNNHVHVNILPSDEKAWRAGKALYQSWAQEVVGLGGTVSAEHGIGKLKTEMLRLQFGDSGIDQMRAVKSVFDPTGLLNPGTLFPQVKKGAMDDG